MIETCALGSVVDVSAGQPAPKPNDFGEDGLPFIRAGSLENLLNGGSLADCEKLPQVTAARKRFRVYPKDTIVFAKSGMSATLGRVYRLPGPAHVVSHLAALVPTGIYDPAFLTYWLRKNPPSHLIKDPAYPSIRVSDIGDVEIPAVPLEEQRRIAEILDKADEIRRKRRQAQELVADFLRSSFLEMFGDPAKNPHSFQVEPVVEHLSNNRAGTQSGPFGSALKKHEYVDEGIPVWGVDNVQHNEFNAKAKLFITEDKFEQLERYRVLPGDILISRAGTVGRMCIAQPPVARSIISTNLVRVVLDTTTLLPEYFVALFTYVPHRLGALKANNKDNAFTFLNPKTLKALEIPIPPMDLQAKFKRLTERTESHAAKMKAQQDGLDDMFASLAQRAFRGEL